MLLAKITKNLNMYHVVAKFVTHLLSLDQKQQHADVHHELLDMGNNDPTFISRVQTEDVSGVLVTETEERVAGQKRKITYMHHGHVLQQHRHFK